MRDKAANDKVSMNMTIIVASRQLTIVSSESVINDLSQGGYNYGNCSNATL